MRETQGGARSPLRAARERCLRTGSKSTGSLGPAISVSRSRPGAGIGGFRGSGGRRPKCVGRRRPRPGRVWRRAFWSPFAAPAGRTPGVTSSGGRTEKATHGRDFLGRNRRCRPRQTKRPDASASTCAAMDGRCRDRQIALIETVRQVTARCAAPRARTWRAHRPRRGHGAPAELWMVSRSTPSRAQALDRARHVAGCRAV